MTKKEIALRNLKLLGVQPDCIKAFEADENDIWCSERAKVIVNVRPKNPNKNEDKDEDFFIIVGLLSRINNGYKFEEECKKAIEMVKMEGYFPYHVVQTPFKFGNTFSVLYIPGDDAEEDLLKKEDFDNNYGYELCSYVQNADDSECSEYGFICVKGAGGGIIRTA